MKVHATTIYGQLKTWPGVRSWKVDGPNLRLFMLDGSTTMERVPRQYVGFWSVR